MSDQPSLKERLQEIAESDLSVCPVQRLYNALDDETATVLRNLVDNGAIPVTRIHNEIRAEGLKLARESLSYHRKGICRCVSGDPE